MKAIGLDIGSVTVGVAISDALMMFANPLTVIRYEIEDDALFNEIVKVVKDNNADVLVVGMPYHMNGDFSEGCVRTRRFEEKIKEKIDIKIVEIDERMTTIMAQNSLLMFDTSRKDRKKVVDKVAASIILQTYLDQKSFK